jgi:hypothetical protein
MWVLPYYMERQLRQHRTDMTISDYRVTYSDDIQVNAIEDALFRVAVSNFWTLLSWLNCYQYTILYGVLTFMKRTRENTEIMEEEEIRSQMFDVEVGEIYGL